MARTIYLSGSISGGRGDVELYRRIADSLEAAGHRLVTRHVADALVSSSGETLSTAEIFDRDLGWLEEAAENRGVLVAEVSTPSIGVGYEIAAARYRFEMPVICLYRPGMTKRCSAMVAGDASIVVIEYRDAEVEEMLVRLERELARLGE